MTDDTTQTTNLTQNLERLNEIVQWFEQQENVDVEAGLEKVREAAQLIKTSKGRLKEIENEFTEIEKELEDEELASEPEHDTATTHSSDSA